MLTHRFFVCLAALPVIVAMPLQAAPTPASATTTPPAATAATAPTAARATPAKAAGTAAPPAAPAPQNPNLLVAPGAPIKKAIESRFAGVKVLDVIPSPINGLYEVYTGDRILYSDSTGDHLIVGSLIDSRTQTDLTQARMDERGAIDFKSLPFDKAIKITKGTGARPLAVFEDPDCPFCQRLEKELARVTDTTVYVFLYPIDKLHPEATLHSRQIWCAPDRAQAWTQWLTEHKPPPGVSSCKGGDPVAALGKLGDDLHIDGTPTLFFANGKRVAGAMSAEEIKKMLAAQSPKS